MTPAIISLLSRISLPCQLLSDIFFFWFYYTNHGVFFGSVVTSGGWVLLQLIPPSHLLLTYSRLGGFCALLEEVYCVPICPPHLPPSPWGLQLSLKRPAADGGRQKHQQWGVGGLFFCAHAIVHVLGRVKSLFVSAIYRSANISFWHMVLVAHDW